jgi:diaminopimelate epimerase
MGRHGFVMLDGGELEIEWLKDGHVVMTGPIATAFTGAVAV